MEIFDPLLNICPVCQSNLILPWFEKASREITFSIWKCGDCSSGFMNPQPTKKYLDTIYSNSYQGHTQPISIEYIMKSEEEYPNATYDAKRIIGVAKSLICKRRDYLKALDIGSGFGFFSRAAMNVGFKVTAVNPGILDNDVFEKMNGFRPIEMFFEDVDFKGKSFDLVILSQLLEHLRDPSYILLKIRKLLSPKGIAAIAVPNVDSIFVKILQSKNNSCFWIPQHLIYFSKNGLSCILQRAGFNIIDHISISRIPYDAISKRLNLRGGIRKIINGLTKILQIPFTKAVDYLGWGFYHNIWAKIR